MAEDVTDAPTARQQAREAADRAFYAMDADPSHAAADAASDVWEPLLRDACVLLRDNGYGGEVARFLLRMGSVLDPADDARFVRDEPDRAEPATTTRTCACDGCWACSGHEPDCTCDVDWDALAEERRDQAGGPGRA